MTGLSSTFRVSVLGDVRVSGCLATITFSNNYSIRIDVSLIDQRHSFCPNSPRRRGEGPLGQKECLGTYVTRVIVAQQSGYCRWFAVPSSER